MATISWTSLTSGDWVDLSAWSTGIAPGATDTVLFDLAGSYVAGIAQGETFSVASLLADAGTIGLGGELVVNGDATIGPSGVLTGGNTLANGAGFTVGGALLVQGVIDANLAGGAIQLLPQTLSVQGVLQASNGGVLAIFPQASFANYASGVLTGGTYEADGASAIDLAVIDAAHGTISDSPIIVDDATIILYGPGSQIFTYDHADATSYTTIEATLATIGAAGVLDILAGRDFVTAGSLVSYGVLALGGGTLDPAAFTNQGGATLVGYGTVAVPVGNGGRIEAQLGTLTLAAGITDTGVLQTDANATLAFSGGYSQPISNAGTIEALSGTLTLSGAITGGGGFFIQGGTQETAQGLVTGPTTTLDLATAAAGNVAFNGAGAMLMLPDASLFAGALVGFGAGDTVDLGGVVSDGATLNGGTLDLTLGGTLVYALPLVGDYTLAQFTGGSDGHGGTTVTVTGVAPRDFSLEGAWWPSRVITWSLATANYTGTFDTKYAFSSFIDPGSQGGYLSVIESAMARWEQVSGITFQQVADSPTTDIRIGWGDLLGGGGEIGQAAYQSLATYFVPDTIVRLEDPVLNGLTVDPSVIGGYAYAGTSSTLYQVALHEIGHALGLFHSTDPGAVMYSVSQGAPNQDVNASDIAGIQAIYDTVPCFAAGTRVLTARGEVAVESLAPGDVVACVLSGRLRRVRWVGRRTVTTARHSRPEDVLPVRIAAGAFGPFMPARPLRLSPDHAVFADGVLVPVRHLVDDDAIRREDVAVVTYVHVELADEAGAPVHDVILAEGMPCETYLDTGNRDAFAGPAMALHPRFARAIWDAQGCAPLAEGGPAVERLRARLRGAPDAAQGVAT